MDVDISNYDWKSLHSSFSAIGFYFMHFEALLQYAHTFRIGECSW